MTAVEQYPSVQNDPSVREKAPAQQVRRLLGRGWAASTLIGFASLGASLIAQPPSGYYDSVDASNSSTLRTTLHDVIDDHIRFPYTSNSTDTWDILNVADEDPGDIDRIIDVYMNASYPKMEGGVGPYNREHTWPNSYGFPDDNSSNYPFTDCHHLFLSDGGYNSSRSNKPYRYCDAGCDDKPTVFNDGRGGGTNGYPADSNWTEGSFTQGTWETWDGRKGDVARAILYMDIRYEGDFHGGTGVDEPDLVVTDNESLIDNSNTGDNEDVAYMGMLSDLLLWHAQDPVDSREVWRNEIVFSHQDNRNPFIDHPEWVECLYEDICDGNTGPAPPVGVTTEAGTELVHLYWTPNLEDNLSGYNVYRGTNPGGPYIPQNTSLAPFPRYSDLTADNGTTYYYRLTAVDSSGVESSVSAEVSATPSSGINPVRSGGLSDPQP